MTTKIKNNKIEHTRGDSLELLVEVTINGEHYDPVEGETVRFAVKHKILNGTKTDYADAEPLILKDIPIGTMLLQLDPEDTKPLGFGTYVYDCEITFTDGRVKTFIPPTEFKLTEEVY